MKRSQVAFTVALAVLAARPAFASPLHITDILGHWQNAVGGPLTLSNNQAGQLTDQIRWGGYLSDQPVGSGYDFTPSANILGAVLSFSHNETPNTPPPSCPPGTIGPYCADVVAIGTAVLGWPITVGSERYTFMLLGFSPDGMTFNSSYVSQENGSNTTRLFGVVSSSPMTTPEPAGLLLLGSGLAAAAAAARRMRRKRQARAATQLAAPPH
jgi:hypothetical protein